MSKINTLDQTFNELQEGLSKVRNSNVLLKKEVELLNTRLKLLEHINIFILISSIISLSLFALMYLKLQ
jgi:hypothetical protein